MPFFIFRNQKVYYKIKGEGMPVLLLHGNTASSKMFLPVIRKYSKHFQVVLIDFPGHGKSQRLAKFETDFWYYNSEVCYALLNKLNLEKVSVIGTSGGALVALNLGLEHPERVTTLIADSFEGEFPLDSYIQALEEDREEGKKKFPSKLFWFMNHGFGWEKVVDSDTKMLMDFYKTGQPFFHKPISELEVPAILTGSRKDEYCGYLDMIYSDLITKNPRLEVFLFESGGHPAMLSNKGRFFELAKQKISVL